MNAAKTRLHFSGVRGRPGRPSALTEALDCMPKRRPVAALQDAIAARQAVRRREASSSAAVHRRFGRPPDTIVTHHA
jgi:hypothetical protein